MIKYLFFLSLLIPLSKIEANTPSNDDSFNQMYSIRSFYRSYGFNTMAEYRYLNNEVRENERTLTLGSRYRIHPNLKLGAFYQLAYGLRHDEDWVKINDRWQWRDTSDRNEDILMVELSPRTLLEFLPGETWSGELRIRFRHNLFNDNNTILLRPGLSYYWFRKGEIFMNFYLQHELYLPLNYGQSTLYQQWTYLGMIYHLAKNIKISPSLSIGKITWEHTDSFKTATGNTYSVKESFSNLGLTLITSY